MTKLLELREQLKNSYYTHESYLRPLLKFLFAFVIFQTVTNSLGFMDGLTNMAIVFALSVVCAFLSQNAMMILAGVLILLHLYANSVEYAVVMLAVFVVWLLLYFRFSPKYGIIMLVMPLACMYKVPAAVPILVGLLLGPSAAIPVAGGTMMYYMLNFAKLYGNSLAALDADNVLSKYQYVIQHAFRNPEMYLSMITLAAVVVVVYAIRRMSMDYAWSVAIVAGAITDLVVMLIGDYILDVEVGLFTLTLGVLGAVVIAVLVQFFVLDLDYTRTERVQFEDDEYYYYVKAVPKRTIAVKDKSVKRIIVHRKKNEEDEA